MKGLISQIRSDQNRKLHNWAQERIVGIFIFTLILVLLLLLYSAGYFAPYLPLTINLVVLISIVLSIVLLQLNSKFIFSLVIFFWLLAALFMVLNIVVWAERASIYAYETLVVGLILYLLEARHVLTQNHDE